MYITYTYNIIFPIVYIILPILTERKRLIDDSMILYIVS